MTTIPGPRPGTGHQRHEGVVGDDHAGLRADATHDGPDHGRVVLAVDPRPMPRQITAQDRTLTDGVLHHLCRTFSTPSSPHRLEFAPRPRLGEHRPVGGARAGTPSWFPPAVDAEHGIVPPRSGHRCATLRDGAHPVKTPRPLTLRRRVATVRALMRSVVTRRGRRARGRARPVGGRTAGCGRPSRALGWCVTPWGSPASVARLSRRARRRFDTLLAA